MRSGNIWKDRLEYEARGLVTRKQFGALLGAGIAMMLPKVANAVAVTDGEVMIKTPDGEGGLLLRAPVERLGRGRARVAGHLRSAAGVPADGQAAGRIRVFGAGGESVLPRQKGIEHAGQSLRWPR